MTRRPALHIFISSTAIDLWEYRDKVREVVLSLSDVPVGMETFSARSGESVDECTRMASEADAVICIVAHRYGYVPPQEMGGDGQRSMTWLEVDAAKRAGRPVFVFIVDAKAPWIEPKEQDRLTSEPAERVPEILKAVQKLQQFKAYLESEYVPKVFSTKDELATLVSATLVEFARKAGLAVGQAPAHESINQVQRLFPSEAVLVKAIAGLLSRMPGTKNVLTVEGAGDTGRDLVFYSEGPFGEPLVSACLVKNSPLRAGKRSLVELRTQAAKALSLPYIDSAGNLMKVSRIYVMSPHELPASDIHWARLEPTAQIEFVTGVKLFELFNRYWPEYMALGASTSGPGISVSRSLKAFVVYSHRDEKLFVELESHLKPLARSAAIDLISDRGPAIGQSWSHDINENLERSDLILLLISPDFLASEYCNDVMRLAAEKHTKGLARVIPVIVRNSIWRNTPVASIQAFPVDGKSVVSWRNRDAAWINVVEGIMSLARQFQTGVRPKSTLTINAIHLENIRCFSKVSIEFQGARCAVIFGKNGVGKTTLLRSIGLCLCPEAKAAGLMEKINGNLLREGARNGSISIELVDHTGRRWNSRVLLERNTKPTRGNATQNDTPTLHRETDATFPQAEILVCGYGAGRHSMATSDPAPEYAVDSAIGTLFDYSMPLQNPELIFRRLASFGKSVDSMMLRIDAALGLEPGSTSLNPTGIQVQGPWGSFIPLGALGDGYQATLAWISDFLGHQALFDSDCPLTEISGVVLVDELEQHLHPSWQRDIVQTLNQQFPKVQFIATSHSPICAAGLADLPHEKLAGLVVLEGLNGYTSATPMRVPAGMRYDEIITSRLIGLDSPRDKTTASLENRLKEIFEQSQADPDHNPEFAQVMEAIRSRSATAAEDNHIKYAEEQLLRTAKDVDTAIRLARRRK